MLRSLQSILSEPSERLGELFLLLVANVGNLFRTDDEFDSTAILYLLKGYSHIDPSMHPSSTFSYFTMIVRNAFCECAVGRKSRAKRWITFSVIDSGDDRDYAADFSTEFSTDFRIGLRSDWKTKDRSTSSKRSRQKPAQEKAERPKEARIDQWPRESIERLIAERLSYGEPFGVIADALNACNFPTIKGVVWSYQLVRHFVLSSPQLSLARNAADAKFHELIREIRQLRNAKYSYAHIAEILNESRALTCRGRPWTKGTVNAVLKGKAASFAFHR